MEYVYNEIIDLLDIKAFYTQFVHKSKPTGKNGQYIGLCPFHQEKNPSFTFNVNDPQAPFNCFTEKNVNGNIIEFVKRIYGISDYFEALKKLASFTNYIPKTKNNSSTNNHISLKKFTLRLHNHLLATPKIIEWFYQHYGITLKTIKELPRKWKTVLSVPPLFLFWKVSRVKRNSKDL